MPFIEGLIIWHGYNGIITSAENTGEWYGMIVGRGNAMQEFKKMDLLGTCIIDAFQYHHSRRSGCVGNMLMLRRHGGGGVSEPYSRQGSAGMTHVPCLKSDKFDSLARPDHFRAQQSAAFN